MTDPKISYICCRSAALRKGKSILELSQSDAMRAAWKELNAMIAIGMGEKDWR
jgi:hypothetical protein